MVFIAGHGAGAGPGGWVWPAGGAAAPPPGAGGASSPRATDKVAVMATQLASRATRTRCQYIAVFSLDCRFVESCDPADTSTTLLVRDHTCRMPLVCACPARWQKGGKETTGKTGGSWRKCFGCTGTAGCARDNAPVGWAWRKKRGFESRRNGTRRNAGWADLRVPFLPFTDQCCRLSRSSLGGGLRCGGTVPGRGGGPSGRTPGRGGTPGRLPVAAPGGGTVRTPLGGVRVFLAPGGVTPGVCGRWPGSGWCPGAPGWGTPGCVLGPGAGVMAGRFGGGGGSGAGRPCRRFCSCNGSLPGLGGVAARAERG